MKYDYDFSFDELNIILGMIAESGKQPRLFNFVDSFYHGDSPIEVISKCIKFFENSSTDPYKDISSIFYADCSLSEECLEAIFIALLKIDHTKTLIQFKNSLNEDQQIVLLPLFVQAKIKIHSSIFTLDNEEYSQRFREKYTETLSETLKTKIV